MRAMKATVLVALISATLAIHAMAGGKGKSARASTTAGASEQVGEVGTITGVVTGMDGKPAAGVAIELRQHKGPKPHRALRVTRTGTDGSFVFENIPVGKLQVRAGAEHVGYATAHVIVKAGASATSKIRLAAEGTHKHKHGGEVQPVEPQPAAPAK